MRASLLPAALAAALALVPAAQADSPLRDFSLAADVSLVGNGDGSDFGTLLVDQVAFAADVLSFYQDRVGNEAFLGTSHGDRLSLRVGWALGDATVHCVVSRVDGAVASGPCSAQGTVAGAGTWVARFDGVTRASVQVSLRVTCLRCD